jgi:hypothetical protein
LQSPRKVLNIDIINGTTSIKNINMAKAMRMDMINIQRYAITKGATTGKKFGQ